MILDFLYTVIFIAIGVALPQFFLTKEEGKYKDVLNKLLIAHFAIAVGFYYFTNNGGGDAWTYWTRSVDMSSSDFYVYLIKEKGTYFIYSFNYFPANVLKMSFFADTMFFALLGYIGFLFFFFTALRVIPYNTIFKGYKLFPLLFFMPNLHFWSSGVGKDSLLFFCIGAFCYSLLNISKRYPLLIVSILLSYFIRPHITLFLFLSFGLAYLFDAKTATFKRFFFMVLLIGASAAIFPVVMKFAKIENNTIEGINDKFSAQALALTKRSRSSLDISSYPLPLKMVTFLYRPLFFDVTGVPALIASFENLLLLVLSFRAFRSKFYTTFFAAPFIIKGLLFFLLIGTFAFASSLGNLGIMIRMRNMFLPGLMIYILWALSFQTQLKLNLKNKLDSAV